MGNSWCQVPNFLNSCEMLCTNLLIFYMSFWWNCFDIKQNANIRQQVTNWDIKKLVIAMVFVCSGTKSQKAEITQNS